MNWADFETNRFCFRGDFGNETMSNNSGGNGSHHSAVPEDELIAGATVAESLKLAMYFV